MDTLTIESLAYGGDGVAHLPDGRTAFVARACPGDAVRVHVIEERRRYVKAEIQELVEPSPDRIAPACPHFTVCGGCTWQHVSYDLQALSKRQAIVDALTRLGAVPDADERVVPVQTTPHQYGYRNKIELLAHTGKRGLALGYHRARSHEIVPVESCLLLPQRLAQAPRALLGALRYAFGSQEIGVHRVGLRVGAHTSDVETAVWTSPGAFPRSTASTTLGRALKNTSVVRVLAKDNSAQRRIAGVEVLSGRGYWRERLGNHTMTVSAPSFFQVNTHAAELLISAVMQATPLGSAGTVIDAYAGAGTFTLPLAQTGIPLTAIESSGSAIRDLRRNLENAHLHADVIGGDVRRELSDIGTADVIIVDPPRTGLGAEIITSIAATGAPALTYVSCDPATLARDAATLRAHGYDFVRATPIDLFPQTYHIETVAAFRRR